MVTMEEFMAECRKDAFKTVQDAALSPAPDSNTAAKSSSETASGSTAATQPTTEQSASSTTTTEQPSASSEQTATVEQPAAEQPATTTEQTAAAEQPAAEQPATTTEQTAAAEQPAAEQPATTTEQPAASADAGATAKPGEILASKLIGTTVMTSDNQNIGEINDIIIDVENQEAAQAIIGVGGFLGIGEKNVAIELNRLKVTTDGATNARTVVLETTADELNQMPEYKAAAN
jgi:sporulation protein YlmC with PRC-barrel domain